ncbi:Multistep phosphorelay regulator 1 [Hypsizygus marmoreus]|uniref:Multistep phosphorelay regulator 1 n=1 Tax=Hypsizygus marmoreus TaxID=39966 RepID=A0A369J9J4_HYPMA|nr:Multistep phosphorelay regulator 1 [Hypsizygus marmoreus]
MSSSSPPKKKPVNDARLPTPPPPPPARSPSIPPRSAPSPSPAPATPKPPPSPAYEEPLAAPESAPTPAPQPPADEEETPDIIDMETFQQILDLDEDNTHDFSRGMAWAYFTQAEQTFKEMDQALEGKDLSQLSSLGHFLKGSSAALGLSKVQASCEKIQHYGQKRDEETGENLGENDALGKIEALLGQVAKEYAAAESWLKKWYDDHAEPEEP